MSDKKKKKLTPTQQEYQAFIKDIEPKRPLARNCILAFLVGGSICAIGQGFTYFYMSFFDFTEKTAGNPTVATMIFLGILLTGFGVYDHLAQWAGAGTAVPVTGFANAMSSAAIEHKSEGFVLGVGTNMFKLAGPVIVYGTVAAFFVALIKELIAKLGG
ncbi:stage V sporulation protein AC [Bacillus horti]|uniref:Stage V sporulation protein AC n=1 Tax=Caldalkalibacillus horti TaxID=77523 RepID=A0ABT9VXL6_9BACI|nr:stage V sporulation protein AC [Bacillus horti]MDQ0165557.1 stage V sporulation protein AC [Bacillus horti]